MRILPRLNEDVNEEWMSDKGRFQYDGLKQQRLNIPLVKGPDGAFAPKRWPEALEAVAQGLQGVKGNEMKAIAGKLSDAETMIALKVWLLSRSLPCQAEELGCMFVGAVSPMTYSIGSGRQAPSMTGG